MIYRNLKKRFKHVLLYLYHKHRNRSKVRFPYSARLSRRCVFEGMNSIGDNTSFYGSMGLGSYVGRGCYISADIGRFSSLGNRITQIVESHPYKEPFVTTSPMFFSQKKQTGHTFASRNMFEEYRFYDKKRMIAFSIGNDCWIGNDVCFIGGVKVSDGAVILSRAIVTKDIPPYAIVGGIPARIIGYRYDEETIKTLLNLKWWHKDISWLRKNWELLTDLSSFKNHFLNNIE